MRLNKRQRKELLKERARASNDPQVLRDQYFHALAVQELPDALVARNAGNEKKQDILTDRYIIECCTSENSRLGAMKFTKDGCEVDRITIEHDFTTETSLKRSIAAAREAADKGYYLALWGSLPCTAGCPWQLLNKKHKTARKKLAQHMRIFHMLILNFRKLAEVVHGLGGDVHFEWPRACTLWRHPKVVEMLQGLAMNTVDFDGCALNLRSARGGLIRKPWPRRRGSCWKGSVLIDVQGTISMTRVRGVTRSQRRDTRT